jgi:hypothetical protein
MGLVKLVSRSEPPFLTCLVSDTGNLLMRWAEVWGIETVFCQICKDRCSYSSFTRRVEIIVCRVMRLLHFEGSAVCLNISVDPS